MTWGKNPESSSTSSPSSSSPSSLPSSTPPTKENKAIVNGMSGVATQTKAGKDRSFVWWGKPLWHELGYVAVSQGGTYRLGDRAPCLPGGCRAGCCTIMCRINLLDRNRVSKTQWAKCPVWVDVATYATMTDAKSTEPGYRVSFRG